MRPTVFVFSILLALPILKTAAGDLQRNIGITFVRDVSFHTDPYYYYPYYYPYYYSTGFDCWKKIFSLSGTFISSVERAFQQEIGLGINIFPPYRQPALGLSFVNYSWLTLLDLKPGLYRIGIEYSPCFWLQYLEISLRLGVVVAIPFVSARLDKQHELFLEVGIYPFEFDIDGYGFYPLFLPFVTLGWNKRWQK